MWLTEGSWNGEVILHYPVVLQMPPDVSRWERGREREMTRREEERPCEDRGGDWSVVTEIQTSRQPPEAGRGKEGFTSRASRGRTVWQTLSFPPSEADVELLLPRTLREKISIVGSHRGCGFCCCYSSHRKLIQGQKQKKPKQNKTYKKQLLRPSLVEQSGKVSVCLLRKMVFSHTVKYRKDHAGGQIYWNTVGRR